MLNTQPIRMLIGLWLILVIGIAQSKGHTLHNPHKKAAPLNRKFNTAAFLNSVANTCAHAGNTIGAQTQQEKQQAACHLLGSIFQTAAVLSEKTQKRNPGILGTVSTAIKATLSFLNTLTPTEKALFLAPHYAYLQAASTLKTIKKQENFIAQTLSNKTDGKIFLDELFSLFKALTNEELPQLFEILHQETLKNLNLG